MNPPLVEVNTTIEAPQRVVWRTLIENPSAMFMGAKVETDWEVGHPITMSGEFNGKRFEDTGEIVSFDPENELSFTHFSGAGDGNLVTIRLQPDGDRTTVVLTQTPTGDRTFSDAQKADYRRNWEAMLKGLETQAEKAAKSPA